MKPGNLVLYTPPSEVNGTPLPKNVCKPYMGFILEKYSDKVVKIHWLEFNQTSDFGIGSMDYWEVIS